MIRDNTKLLRCTLLLSIVFIFAARASTQDTSCPKDGRPDCLRAVAFFHTLQTAIIKDDRKAVAEMMEYPFLTFINHKKVHILTPVRLLQHFDEIFNKQVRCEIKGATDENVWGNWQGFTIKGGAIWFDDLVPPGEKIDPKSPDFWVKGSFKVITVNNDSFYSCFETGMTGK